MTRASFSRFTWRIAFSRTTHFKFWIRKEWASWSRSELKEAAGTRPDLKVGICGEHGGDPASVMFCHRIGLSYVSCSPFRVPIARLAAAQAALGSEQTISQTA